MSQQRKHAHETHVSTVNKIRTMSKLITQICRVCKLTNRSCYVIVEMSDKCAFCAETEKTIKQCDVTSHNYIFFAIIIHLNTSSKDDELALSFNSTSIVFSFSFLDLLETSFFISINKSDDVFVFNSFKSMKNVVVSKQYNSSTSDSHLFFSSVDQIARAVRTMKIKLSTMMNKLTTLKIKNIRLFKRIKELENRIEDTNVMKNVDAAIDYLDRDFSDEVLTYT